MSYRFSPAAPSVQVSDTLDASLVVADSAVGAPVTGPLAAGTHACVIAPMSRRPPVTVLPANEAVGATLEMMALRMADAEMRAPAMRQAAANKRTRIHAPQFPPWGHL